MELKNEEIGKRLTKLREALGELDGTNWGTPRLAKELRVTQNVIFRLEQGKGSLHNLVKLLNFYHDKGFNMLWVLANDNDKIPMRWGLSEQTNMSADMALEKLYSIQALLGNLQTK